MEILSKKVLISILLYGLYYIQANANEDVLKSFFRYLSYQILPNIQTYNIDEYEELNNELEIPLF